MHTPKPIMRLAVGAAAAVAACFASAARADLPSVALFRPGDGGRTCFRIPALLNAGDALLAFAESRTGVGDGCYPRRPAPGDGRTSIVFRRSDDGGATWSKGFSEACPSNTSWDPATRRAHGCFDYEVAWDAAASAVVLQYCEGASSSNCTNKQVISRDLGRTWEAPTSMAAVLGTADGSLVGPGRGLQLQSSSHGRRCRLLFCGHKQDSASGRVSPVWASDDGGATYALKALFPHGSPEPVASHGPDECQMAELADGRVLYNARNNWVKRGGGGGGSSSGGGADRAAAPATGPPPGGVLPFRMTAWSDDGGDTWSRVRYDTSLPGLDCQGSLVSTAALSDTLWFSHPSTAARTNLTVRRSDDGARTWSRGLPVHGGGAAYSCLSPIPGDSERVGLLFERDGDGVSQCGSAAQPSQSCFIAFAFVPASLD